MAAPGLKIATINHDMNERHTKYTYGKVTIKKNAWLGMNVTICPGVTIGEYEVVAAVYGGGKGRWRLQGNFTLRKENGNWKFTSSRASTY